MIKRRKKNKRPKGHMSLKKMFQSTKSQCVNGVAKEQLEQYHLEYYY